MGCNKKKFNLLMYYESDRSHLIIAFCTIFENCKGNTKDKGTANESLRNHKKKNTKEPLRYLWSDERCKQDITDTKIKGTIKMVSK